MPTALVLMTLAVVAQTDSLDVAVDFPGASAAVETVDREAGLIRLTPLAHKGRGWACWWYFKVSGIKRGEVIAIDVGPAPWATPDRAAFSVDGKTWRQTAAGKRDGKRIVYRQQIDAEQAWFAWGPPFAPDDARTLVESTAERSSHAEAFVLCETREGRVTPALRISESLAKSRATNDADKKSEGSTRPAIWIQARQHAWEAGSSWVAKGLVDWLVSDEAIAQKLRQRALITVVPIMDIDNAHRGAGGKAQSPQDHNRDWTKKPHWRSVAAAQKEMLRYDAEGCFALFVDLHNPGANDRQPYFYVPPDELLPGPRRRYQQEFLAAVVAEMQGPLAFEGRTIVSGPKYDARRWTAISKNWVAAHCQTPLVSVTLETPWNTSSSTMDGYQRVGRELGHAIERFLRNRSR